MKKTSISIFILVTGCLILFIGLSFFPFKWTEVTSSIAGRTPEQIRNIQLAVEKLDRSVIKPGEVFSFNMKAGPYSLAEGYVPERAFLAGRIIDSAGGGVCQVSSTLYYALLRAGLLVTERSPHFFPISSLPMGIDATVADNGVDLCFKNNTNMPVMVQAKVQDKRVYIVLRGALPRFTLREIDRRVEKVGDDQYRVQVFTDKRLVSDELYYIN